MSHDIKRIIDIIEYCEGILSSFAVFYNDLENSKERITIDTGVYDHLFPEDRNYNRQEDIFILHNPEWGIDMNDVLEVLTRIEKHLKRFDVERSFFFNSIWEKEKNYYMMDWGS